MTPHETLEQVWDESYSVDRSQRLWPDEPVPAVAFAGRNFRQGAMILDLPCGDGKNVLALLRWGR